MFFWLGLASRGAILTDKNLRKSEITYVSWCLCKHSGEDVDHLTACSIMSMVGDLKMVRDTMYRARYYEGCTIQLGL